MRYQAYSIRRTPGITQTLNTKTSNSVSILVTLYTEFIYRPLLNGLVFVYVLLPYQDLGLAILVLTLIVRIILHPALVHTYRSQQAMARLQPQLQEIQARFKANREELARRTMALYRSEGVHPMSGCLPVLIQLPILIGLYQVFWKGIKLEDRLLLYPFVPQFGTFDTLAFGLFDLAAPSIILAVAAGASQWLQAQFVPQPVGAVGGGGDFQKAMAWQMKYFFPLLIAGISWSLPSALGFYWTGLNLFAIVEQRWLRRRLNHGHQHSRPHP